MPRLNSLCFAASILVILCASHGVAQTIAAAAPRTPSETVREFYLRLRERRFQDALMLSVYRPAIEKLSAAELAELRPEFEALAANVPAHIEITGEQTSGDTSTVFMKLTNEATGKPEVQPVTLMRAGGAWIIGDREASDAAAKLGAKYFFEVRIEMRHAEASLMMQRIAQAQLAYSLQHGGQVADLSALVAEGLLPKDILTPDLVGYRYRITLAPDRRSFTANAEPVAYNRTGRFSFAMNKDGMQRKDNGGKPLADVKIKK